MAQLTYRCPHCLARVEVPFEKVGQVNQCTACGQPFQPEVPVARAMLQRADGEWSVAGGAAVPGQPLDSETTIMTVYPAMFRVNPIKYVVSVLAFIVGLAGMFYFAAPLRDSAVHQWWRPVTIGLSILFGIVAAASLSSLIYWLVRTRFESLTITSERTIWKRGIFDRRSSEVQHDDVRNIQMRQLLVDRILGVGRIAISSAGQDDMEIDIHGVPDPSRVADTVRSCQARMQGRTD